MILVEFGYGGKIFNSMLMWVFDGMKLLCLVWYLKEKLLFFIYWEGMLKGREWLVKLEI